MTDAVMDTVVGVLDGITEKPTGWTEITVRVDGLEYPVKMATKLQPLVELARAAGTNTMAWSFKKQDSEKLNPNSGKPYVNRYFEGVEPAGAQNAPAAPTVTRGDPKADVDWDAKERRDYRSRAWAQTLGAFNHTIKVDEPVVDVFLRLQPFQRKVYEDVTGRFAYPEDGSDAPF